MTYLSLNYDRRSIARIQDMTYLSLNYDRRSIARIQDMTYLNLNYDHRTLFARLWRGQQSDDNLHPSFSFEQVYWVERPSSRIFGIDDSQISH
jgi:hypothetical protein